MLWNATSIKNKNQDFQKFLEDIVTETWLALADALRISDTTQPKRTKFPKTERRLEEEY